MRSRLICISGPDGTGKSTQVDLLINSLKEIGFNYEYRWLRFHHLLSLPLLAIARLKGLSEVKTLDNGEKIGYHHFNKSKTVSWLYSLLLLLDTVIFTIAKVYIPIYFLRKSVVYDRFIYDTLIDLMVSTGNYDIYKSNIGNLFLKLIPENSNVLMLITDESTLRNRRDDVFYDETLSLKIKLYKNLSKKFNIPVIDASLPVEEVHNKIIEKIS